MSLPDIVHITDFAAPELAVFADYSEVQLLRRDEPEPGIFLAESAKVIHRALDVGYEPLAMVVEETHLGHEATQSVFSRCPECPVYTAPFSELSPWLGYKLTSGMLCAMRRLPHPAVEDVCAGVRRLAVLEDVVNPTNIGAIFRSAAALGMDAVLLTPGCCDPLYRRAIRVSMGNVFQIPWTFFEKTAAWPEDGMRRLRELGFWTVAMALGENSAAVDDVRLKEKEKLAVILGTEGDGLAARTIADCDDTVRIPMSHGVDSLNVAAASAVAFWELGNHGL